MQCLNRVRSYLTFCTILSNRTKFCCIGSRHFSGRTWVGSLAFIKMFAPDTDQSTCEEWLFKNPFHYIFGKCQVILFICWRAKIFFVNVLVVSKKRKRLKTSVQPYGEGDFVSEYYNACKINK